MALNHKKIYEMIELNNFELPHNDSQIISMTLLIESLLEVKVTHSYILVQKNKILIISSYLAQNVKCRNGY